jgi:hypothetical protein
MFGLKAGDLHATCLRDLVILSKSGFAWWSTASSRLPVLRSSFLRMDKSCFINVSDPAFVSHCCVGALGSKNYWGREWEPALNLLFIASSRRVAGALPSDLSICSKGYSVLVVLGD